MDAIHLACAIEWGADLFLTADHHQYTAAQNANLAVQLV
jgi:predicted nucleic acid-binding protein